MERSKRSYFKLILHHTGLAIVIGERDSQKHERCCDPLYTVNFSVTSVGPELARPLYTVGRCVEILWAHEAHHDAGSPVWSWET